MNKQYIESEYIRMHEKKYFDGGSLEPHVAEIKGLIEKYDVKSLLDYGCGKARCHKKEKLAHEVYLYDPYYAPYNIKPKGGFDMVICTDVLEHVPEDEVGKVAAELINYTNKILYLAISTKPARKLFRNGENVHLTIKPKEWWESMFSNGKGILIVSHYS